MINLIIKYETYESKSESILTKPRQNISQSYVEQWKSLAVTSDFISLTYGSGGSGVIYNLYADKLLQTGLIDNSVGDICNHIKPASDLVA